ncbi:MAG: PAS domain-containing hybrid sensor histidine kinase/response regulator [Phycisphaerales bacterium]|nr:PAS domain-containing hybrid sensor histidine kinase/response regulator [Phycisphaerales bacterium]
MIRSARTISLLAAGCGAAAAFAFFASLVLGAKTEPTSELGRGFVGALLILSALIVALPSWRWWVACSRTLSSALLLAACSGLVIPHTFASTGLMSALTLVALASFATTVRATAGRWPAAISASAVLGLTLYAVLAPNPTELGDRAADRFADIAVFAAAALSVAAVALLARAWVDAPTKSLGMPGWIGMALAVVFMSLSFSAWKLLVDADRVAMERHTDSSEKIFSYIFRTDFDKMLSAFEQFGQSLGSPDVADPAAFTSRATQFTRDNPGLVALEWANAEGNIVLVTTAEDLAHPGDGGFVPLDVRRELIKRASDSHQIAMTGPVLVNGRESTLLAAVPPSGKGCFLAVMSVDRTMTGLMPVFSESFDAEVYFRGRLLAERDDEPGPSIKGAGRLIPVGGESITLKLEPSAALRESRRSILPKFLLASTLAASMLLGLTAFLAQTSRHGANLAKRARSQLEQLIEGAHQVAVIATDCDGLITIFNHGAERLSGWRASDLVRTRDASCLFDPEELAWVLPNGAPPSPFAPLATLASDRRAHERDWTWRRPDGGHRRVNLAANPWRDSTGELVGFIFVAVDVTEREAAMRALDHARRTADRASSMKSSFLANVSHEIRTPMTAILGCADLLLDGETTEAERRDFAQTVRRNGEHLLEVLNDILDISKIEAGQLRIEMLEVQLPEIVDEVAQLMRVRGRDRAIPLTITHVGSDPPRLIRTDPLRVRQILVNLIGNALKFTQRGSVSVVIRTAVDGHEMAAAIEVRDTGIGLSESQIKGLFQSFEQGDSSTARRFGGTGLGLAISQRLAQLLNGSISVVSKLGEGSTFTFEFRAPLATQSVEAPSSADATALPPVRLDGRRILLVDDSFDTQRLVASLLRRGGAEVEVVDHGRRALEAIELAGSQRSFDVILLDMQMPELDGYATAQELRRRGYAGRIVALTGNAIEDDRERCLAAGCDDYAIKPIARLKLLAICAPAMAKE